VIALSTCRRPTQRMNSFVKDLFHSLPNCTTITRGKMSLQDLTASAARIEAHRLILVNRWKSDPGEIRLLRLAEGRMQTVYPIILLREVKLRRDYRIRGRFTAEAVTCDENMTDLGFASVLASFLGLPLESVEDSYCTLHLAENHSGRLSVNLTSPPGVREIGPSFIVRQLLWS
jgi:rRNA maturation protein Rpf1